MSNINRATAAPVQSVITELYQNPLTSTLIQPNVLTNHWVPCYALGQPAYAWYYLAAGFVVPVLVVLFLLGAWLKRKTVKWLQLRKKGEYESLEEAEDILGTHNVQPHLDKVKAIVIAAEKRSVVWSWIADISTSNTKKGEWVMIGAIFWSVISFVLYLVATSSDIASVEMCGTMPNVAQIIDFIANFYLLCYFIVRLVGTEKKTKVLLSGHSIVDYFCIPAVLIGVFQDRYFTGENYLLFGNLLQLVNTSVFIRQL